jgi:hypothetical protein
MIVIVEGSVGLGCLKLKVELMSKVVSGEIVGEKVRGGRVVRRRAKKWGARSLSVTVTHRPIVLAVTMAGWALLLSPIVSVIMVR